MDSMQIQPPSGLAPLEAMVDRLLINAVAAAIDRQRRMREGWRHPKDPGFSVH